MFEVDNGLKDRLIDLYFLKQYRGARALTEDEENFLNREFKVIVTENSLKNGGSFDKKLVSITLEVNKEYTLLDMGVSEYSSALRLKEFPQYSFNTVNFEFLSV